MHSWLLSLSFSFLSAAHAPEEVLRAGLVYSTQGSRQLAADLYHPGAPEEAPCVLLIGGSLEAAIPGRRDPRLMALGSELSRRGVAALLFDYAADTAGQDLRRVTEYVRQSRLDLRLDGGTLGVHAAGDGVQLALEGCMERGLACSALSLHSAMGVVIEGLRTDLAVLVIQEPSDPEAVQRGQLEFLLQAELCGTPASLLQSAGDQALREAAAFHAARLAPLPGDPAAIQTCSEALSIARVHAERDQLDASLQWLERAEELGEIDLESLVHDTSWSKVRVRAAFKDWIGDRVTEPHTSLCRPFEPGRRIRIQAQILAHDGVTPLRDTRVFLHQTDATGLYSYQGGDDAARLWGWVMTDASGRFSLDTIAPGGYPRTMIPAHIHVRLVPQGQAEQHFEFVFDHDPRMVESGRRRADSLGWPIVKLSEGTEPAEGVARLVLR